MDTTPTIDPDGLRARFAEIFSDEGVFLRELLQNAIEAIGRASAEFPRIDVTTDIPNAVLEVRDNGIGMDFDQARAAITRFFGSFWGPLPPANGTWTDPSSGEEPLNSIDKNDMSSIGRFGMGLTTCLMVADNYEVTTAPLIGRPCSRHCVCIGSGIDGDRALRCNSEILDGPNIPGTSVRVHFRSQIGGYNSAWLDGSTIEQAIRHYAGLVDIPIFLNGSAVVVPPIDPVVFPEIFSALDPDPQGPVRIFARIARREPGGYLRARLSLTAEHAGSGELNVWSRGIFVGRLPAGEVLGPSLDKLRGVLDSNLFDLQLDRNRVARNDRLQEFQARMARWIAEALIGEAERDWDSYAEVFEAHRNWLLPYIWSTEERMKLMGDHVPFVNISSHPHQTKPFRFFRENRITLRNGGSAIAAATPKATNELAVAALRARTHPVMRCDTYMVFDHGRTNIDMYCAIQFARLLGTPARVVRVDAILPDVLEVTPTAAGAAPQVIARVRDWLPEGCLLYFANIPDDNVPIMACASRADAIDEEVPRPYQPHDPEIATVQAHPFAGLEEPNRERQNLQYNQFSVIINLQDRGFRQVLSQADAARQETFLRCLLSAVLLQSRSAAGGIMVRELATQLVALAIGTAERRKWRIFR